MPNLLLSITTLPISPRPFSIIDNKNKYRENKKIKGLL
jgi:hypothetical protein